MRGVQLVCSELFRVAISILFAGNLYRRSFVVVELLIRSFRPSKLPVASFRCQRVRTLISPDMSRVILSPRGESPSTTPFPPQPLFCNGSSPFFAFFPLSLSLFSAAELWLGHRESLPTPGCGENSNHRSDKSLRLMSSPTAKPRAHFVFRVRGSQLLPNVFCSHPHAPFTSTVSWNIYFLIYDITHYKFFHNKIQPAHTQLRPIRTCIYCAKYRTYKRNPDTHMYLYINTCVRIEWKTNQYYKETSSYNFWLCSLDGQMNSSLQFCIVIRTNFISSLNARPLILKVFFFF